jgi:hypothetical protein
MLVERSKTAQPNGIQLGRDHPLEVEIQICTNGVDPSWGGAQNGN